MVDFNDEEKLKSEIKELYNQYKTGNLKVDSVNIDQYHRKNLTEELSKIIKKLTS